MLELKLHTQIKPPCHKLDVIVIGTTGLCLECCKLLNNLKYNILAVVSDDKFLQKWCSEENIECITYDKFKVTKYKQYILFSIINYRIIPTSLIIKHKVELAINYRPSVKNEGVWDIGVLNWKIFNLFFIFWLAIAE